MADAREVIEQALSDYGCYNTCTDDDERMPLVDMLCPPNSTSIDKGAEELKLLADHIVGALIDAGIVPHGVKENGNG